MKADSMPCDRTEESKIITTRKKLLLKLKLLLFNSDNQLLKKYYSGRATIIFSFGISGGLETGARFIDALELITHLVNISDAKSLACHPATATRRQLSDEELKTASA